MKVIRKNGRMAEAGAPLGGAFVGVVSQLPLLVYDTEQLAELIFVEFDSDAHTHWHTHDAGQVLLLVEGQGAVVTESESVRLNVGDCVVAAPGERHWHGSAPETGGGAVFLAASLGGEEWFDAPVLLDGSSESGESGA